MREPLRILLFGKYGQLGWELHRSLLTLGDLTVLYSPEVDINQPQSLPEIVRAAKPDIARRINADAVGEIFR